LVKIVFLSLIPSFLGVAGCTKRAVDDCAQKLPNTIRVGSPQKEAEQILDQCGFSHSFDERTSTIYALKPAYRGIVTRSDWTVVVKLDEHRQVTSVKVREVGTGP
jgi:hypothetical protein